MVAVAATLTAAALSAGRRGGSATATRAGIPAVASAAFFVPAAAAAARQKQQQQSPEIQRHVSFVGTPRRLIYAAAARTEPATTTQQQKQRSVVCCPLAERAAVGSTTTRLYHSSPLSNRNDNDDENQGFLAKAKNVAKKFLPAKWFRSDEEKRADAERERVKTAVKSEIQQVFKDAPLPLRVLGGMIGPLLGGMLSNLAETAASQEELVEAAFRQAVACVSADAAVAEALSGGGPVTVGRPFAQASSSSSINGETTTRVELSFPVAGSRTQGVGRLVATSKGGGGGGGGGITSPPALQLLEVQVNGRVIPVSTMTPSKNRAKYASSKNRDDNIIEAEIIEKDTKLK